MEGQRAVLALCTLNRLLHFCPSSGFEATCMGLKKNTTYASGTVDNFIEKKKVLKEK